MVNGRSMGKPYSTSINRHSVAETEGKGSGFLAKISDITKIKAVGSKNVY